MTEVKLYSTVNVPGENKIKGSVTYLSECKRYCRIRYAKGKKVKNEPYSVEEVLNANK